MDDKADHQPERVGDDRPLPALDPLAGVEAANPATFGGLHGLAIDDARRWACFPALELARGHCQMIADRSPQSAVAPVVEIPLHR